MSSLLLTLAGACASPDAPPAPLPPAVAGQPDIVLVTIDTLRADRIGAYGDPEAQTPTSDGLAASGALYRDAWSPVPLTLPAHTAMMSGRWPTGTGVLDNGAPVPRDLPLLAPALAAAGYHTGAFVSAYVLDSSWGLDRGFAAYGDDFNPDDVSRIDRLDGLSRPGRDTVRAAAAWWANAPSPRFLWVHLFDPHTPYAPSADWPPTADPYRGEVFEADRALAPLLAAVGDEAWVVLTSDHGEALWEGGEPEHGLLLGRSVLRIPLIVRPPGGLSGAEAPAPGREPPPAPVAPVALAIPTLDTAATRDAPRAARVVAAPVSLVDVAPTVRAIAGLPHEDADGVVLPGLGLGDGPSADRVRYAVTHTPLAHYGWSAAAAAFGPSSWVSADPDAQRFRLPADPWLIAPSAPLPEDAPLVADVDRLLGQLRAHEAARTTADERLRLEALGYLQAAPVAPPDPPSARSQLPSLHAFRAATLSLPDHPEDAVRQLSEVTQAAPTMTDAWTQLGLAHALAGDPAAALEAWRRAFALAPDAPITRANLVLALRAQRDLVGAAALATEGAQRFPDDPRWYRFLADFGGQQEDPVAVKAACARGLQIDPRDPYLHYMYGLALLQTGAPETAILAFDAAKEHGSRARDIDLWRGKVFQQLGQPDKAVAAWLDQARATPTDLRPVALAAVLLADADRCKEAAPLLFTLRSRGGGGPELERAWAKCGG
jgi:arylsulfatase A-like enzyme/tetratricopeptide (TPR) repeat protein